MKITTTLFLSAFLFSHFAFAQVSTIVLKPDATIGKDAFLASVAPTTNYGTHPELCGEAWTCGGSPCFGRGLIQFDLSAIPYGAIINSAKLSLYANPSPVNGNGVAMQGNNSATIQRVTGSWNESSVTWSTAPTTTTLNEVILSQSSQPAQDYLNIDVQGIVQDMVNDPANSFGFFLQLNDETPYATMIFASSDYNDPNLWPEIRIEYTPSNCYQYLETNSLSDDSYLASSTPSTTFANHPEFAADAWTCSGSPCFGRGVIKFDLSSIPTTATVTSANLNLYANPTPVNGNGVAMQGANAAWLQRIVTPWDGTLVTWNSAPTTTTQNQVDLPQSSSPNQDYLNIDVTALVSDMIASPSTSYGMLLRLQTEVYYSSMIFASADYSNTALHPSLEVCYTLPDNIISPENFPGSVSVFPNPISGTEVSMDINLTHSAGVNISLLDMQGRMLDSFNYPKLNQGFNRILLQNAFENKANGIYFIKVEASGSSVVTKVVKL